MRRSEVEVAGPEFLYTESPPPALRSFNHVSPPPPVPSAVEARCPEVLQHLVRPPSDQAALHDFPPIERRNESCCASCRRFWRGLFCDFESTIHEATRDVNRWIVHVTKGLHVFCGACAVACCNFDGGEEGLDIPKRDVFGLG
jgi:hypothetical protein